MTTLRIAQIVILASATLAALLLMLRDAREFERRLNGRG